MLQRCSVFVPARLFGLVVALTWVSAARGPAWVHADTAGKRSARPASSVIDASSDVALVDFTRGLIVAAGEAAADLRAPSPEVARVKAERQARELARRRLVERARALLAADESNTADERLEPARERALAHALAHVIDLDVTYASDGSVVLQTGLPLEALRTAIGGVPAYAPVEPGDEPYESVLIDARGVLARPVFGVRVQTSSGPVAGPIVLHRSVERALDDPRIGDRILVVRARRSSSGTPATSQGKPASAGVVLELDPAENATSVHVRERGAPARSASASAGASIEQVGPALASGALLVIVIGKGT